MSSNHRVEFPSFLLSYSDERLLEFWRLRFVSDKGRDGESVRVLIAVA